MLLKVRLPAMGIAVLMAGLAVMGISALMQGRGPEIMPNAGTPAERLLALQLLDRTQRQSLADVARSQLRSNPLDAEAIFNLAVLAELDGEIARRDRLIAAGAKRSRRDARIQLAALETAVSAKDHALAADIADGLLRARPEFSEQVFSVAGEFVAEPAGLSAIARRIEHGAPWRLPFLRHLMASDPVGLRAYRYLSGLGKHGVPPSDGEIATVISTLMAAKDYDKAYFFWLDMLPLADLQRAGLIFDGGFDLPPRNLLFDWSLRRTANSNVMTKAREGAAADKALVAELWHSKGIFAGARQYLRLAPGAYALDAEAEVREAKGQGLAWRLRCVESRETVGESGVFAEDQPWERFNISFAIPGDRCETQLLQLESAQADGPQLDTSGRYSFDNFLISER